MSARKPHNDFAGYVSERRNPLSGGHTIILDCKRAEDEGNGLVDDYQAEGGRYQILCNEHGHVVYSPNLPAARECMKDATIFCTVCRAIAGEIEPEDAGLSDEDISLVHRQRGRCL